MTPMKAIRAKCLDCMYDSAKEVRLCPSKNCPLFQYRLGKNPARAGIGKKGHLNTDSITYSNLEGVEDVNTLPNE